MGETLNDLIKIFILIFALGVPVAAIWPKKPKAEITREPLKTANLSLDGPGADLEQ